MVKDKRFFILVLLVLYGSLFAQYTIPGEERPAIGTATTFFVDTTGSAAVDVGAAGENVYWDFTQLGLTGIPFQQQVLDVTTSSAADSFPDGQWVVVSKQWLSVKALPPVLPAPVRGLFTMDIFERMENDTVYGVGIAAETPFYSGAFRYEKKSVDYPYPLEYGKGWVRKNRFGADVTIMIGTTPLPVTLLISDSTALEVDAWGEIALPVGTYPCLRLKTHRFLDVKAFVLGSWVTVSDDDFMIYEWHVRKAGMIMQIVSHSGETSETFTEAGLVLRMDDSNVLTGVECDPQCAGESGIPEAFTLMQNYPNPFNPSTTITYALSEPSNADLRIYSLLGQEIMAVSEVKEAGLHRFTWYGTDRLGRQVPGGIYFYRLEAQPLSGGSAFLDIRKMILMK